MEIKTFYFTLGQAHKHVLSTQHMLAELPETAGEPSKMPPALITWDASGILAVKAADEWQARNFVFTLAADKWSHVYNHEELAGLLSYMPKGVIGTYHAPSLYMPALSVKQPFASMIADGRKTLEVRSKKTSFRGRVLICSSKKLHGGWVLYQDMGKLLFKAHDIATELPEKYKTGCAVGLATLIGCRPFVKEDELAAMVEYVPNMYVWEFSNAKYLFNPEFWPVTGRLGFYNSPYFKTQF